MFIQVEEESETRRERSDKGPPAQARTFKLPWASGGDSEIPPSSAYGALPVGRPGNREIQGTRPRRAQRALCHGALCAIEVALAQDSRPALVRSGYESHRGAYYIVAAAI
jgi:hypothetical protein